MDNVFLGSLKSIQSLNNIQNDIKDIELNIKEEIARLEGKTHKGE